MQPSRLIRYPLVTSMAIVDVPQAPSANWVVEKGQIGMSEGHCPRQSLPGKSLKLQE
jgi:hypothetical protein